MPFTRYLRYKLPLMRGDDVLEVQSRLVDLGYAQVGEPDGLFGARTAAAIRVFQDQHGLVSDGVVGPRTYGQPPDYFGFSDFNKSYLF